MAYSIYVELKPSALNLIMDNADLCLMQEFFEPDFRQKVETDHGGYKYLFYYLKPRDDSCKILQLFHELSLLAEQGHLINLSDDKYSPKPRVWEHSAFPDILKPYAIDVDGRPVFIHPHCVIIDDDENPCLSCAPIAP